MKSDIEEKVKKHLERIFSEQKIEEKPALKSKIWTKVNPIYEALAKCFSGYIDDELIAQKIAEARDTDETGILLGLQSLIGLLSENKKGVIVSELQTKKDVKEIVKRTSLEIAEDGRIQNGRILYPLTRFGSMKHSDIISALKSEQLSDIYLAGDNVTGLTPKIRKARKARLALASLAVSFEIFSFIFGGYVIRHRREYIQRYIDRPRIAKEQVCQLERTLQEKKSEESGLEERISSKKAEIVGFETEYSDKKSELTLLNAQYTERQVQLKVAEEQFLKDSEEKKAVLSAIKEKIQNNQEKNDLLETQIRASEETLREKEEEMAELGLDSEKREEIARYLFAAGLKYHELNETENAKGFFESALVLDPSSESANNALGVLYLNEGNYQKAKTFLEASVTSRPSESLFYRNLGIYYEQVGDLENALKSYKREAELSPLSEQTYYNLGRVSLSAGKKQEAFDNFNKYLRLGSDTNINTFKAVTQQVKQLEQELRRTK